MSVGAGAECEGSGGDADRNRDLGGVSVHVYILRCACLSGHVFFRHSSRGICTQICM